MKTTNVGIQFFVVTHYLFASRVQVLLGKGIEFWSVIVVYHTTTRHLSMKVNNYFPILVLLLSRSINRICLS